VAKVNPVRILGRWREGFALDYHTLSSLYVGDDEFGHPVFDTQRSDLGELLYRLKYRAEEFVADEIVQAAAEFVRGRQWGVEVVVPVPPTRTARIQQPVLVLARRLGETLGLPVSSGCLVKTKDLPELKNVFDYNERLSLLAGAFNVVPAEVAGRTVLLLDDLYRSGATMNAVADALKEFGGAADVYVLAITRTRRKS
jgi:predicted amidophosphoribosyltransferase